MNDPNGLIQWGGKYHLFYQHNPTSAIWGDMHWGHATSTDLIHWTDLPIAIAPTPGTYDETGIFSGCAVNNAGVPTIIYTSTRGVHNEIQTQSLATSVDGLVTWEKHPDNPVIRDVPPESGQTRDFRDPFVWKEDAAWYMVLGSRIQDVGGTVFLYRSPNLIDWEYLHPLLVGDINTTGSIWECPNFFKLGDEWVLIISTHTGTSTDTVIYVVGSYENQQFTPVYQGVLDHARLYAPLTTLDSQNRRLLFGWLREDRPNDELLKAGWAGVQSIPRVLTLDHDHHLHMTPVPELTALRGQHHHLDSQSEAVSISVSSAALDIDAQFTPKETCGLTVVFSSATQEKIDILYNAVAQQLIVNQTVRGADDAISTRVQQAPHAAGQTLHLRVLVDGSVIEIIADEQTSLTSRVYPSTVADCSVQIIGSQLHTLDVWEMPSIWQ
jgi:beta-fructofuranosidase